MTDRVSIVEADAIDFLNSLEDDSVDLLFGSPPYEAARTYGIGFKLSGQAWVDWMVRIVQAAAPKVKGLIAINCEGQTRGYSYSGVPFLLFADLKRAGFNMRKPVVFHRVGIPGSGGPDWLRNDWEPVICVTRPGRLPFSDNVACGHTPKWDAGGEISHRNAAGKRVNANRGTTGNVEPHVLAAINGEVTLRPGAKLQSCPRKDGTMRMKVYNPPEKANPGNVLSVTCGGGKMGSPIAHDNEAPFPLDLPAFFVKSFCPPNGIVCDPWSGSGTTAHAAYENGRRFTGCDIRASQVELTKRRIATVTPTMFATGAT